MKLIIHQDISLNDKNWFKTGGNAKYFCEPKTNEQFIEEWKKRNFKTDFTNCSIKLPENYLTDCYFNNLIYIKIYPVF